MQKTEDVLTKDFKKILNPIIMYLPDGCHYGSIDVTPEICPYCLFKAVLGKIYDDGGIDAFCPNCHAEHLYRGSIRVWGWKEGD